MVVTINEVAYNVKFGIGFIRELDKKYFTQSQSGIKFGIGLEVKIPMLLANDPITLSEFLYEGTCTEEVRPTQQEIDDYIDSAKNIEELFSEVVKELKKHNATKLQMKAVEEQLKAEAKSLEVKK